MISKAYPFIYLPAMILVFSVFFLHFGFVVLPLSCFSLGILLRVALKKNYLPVFSFLIPILPACAVFAESGFPNNYLILPLLVLAGIVIADIVMNREFIGAGKESLPRHYVFYLIILSLSFVFIMLRWSNVTHSPLAFFRDTQVAPNGQRLSFGIIFPVVEMALFALSPLYYLLLQRQTDLRRILVAFLSGQSLSIFYSGFQRLQGQVSQKTALYGLASDATSFGFLSALGLFLSWYLYFRFGCKKTGLLFSILSLIGILNSSTRIGLIVAILVFLLFVSSAKKKILAFALVVLLLTAALLLYLFIEPGPGPDLLSRLKANFTEFVRIAEPGGKDPGSLQNLVSNRGVLWRYSWECLRNFPLSGVGTGNFVFWVMHANHGAFLHHLPANQYFFISASTGLLGLSVFVLFCLGLFTGKQWPEKIALGMFLFLLIFNDYLWFSEVFLVFWLFCSLGEPGGGDSLRPSKSTAAFTVSILSVFVLINLLKYNDLHPITWAKANAVSYDYGLSYIESKKEQWFQWTGKEAGVFIYLDADGRNSNFRLVCGAPLSRFKDHRQTVDIFWRGRFYKRAVFRENDEYPLLIEDKKNREGFLEFRVQPDFSLKQMNLGREARKLGVQLFGADIPSIQLGSPNGGENWLPGSIQDIHWQSKGNVASVKIEISYDGGRTYATIGDSIVNQGLYSWQAENGPSMNCLVRISNESGAGSDTSDQPFAIASPPSFSGFSFSPPKSWIAATFGSDGWYVGDFNGDGRSDLMRYLAESLRNEVFLSTGTGFAYAGHWLTGGNGTDGWYVGDFNGDGRSDLMRYLTGSLRNEVFLSQETGFANGGHWLTGGNGADGWYVGDFNGDGRSDLMMFVPGRSGGKVFLSEGQKFVPAGSWTGANPGLDGWYMGDFNGDKQCDIMRYAEWMAGSDLFLAGHRGFMHDGNWSGAGRGDADWHIGDFNGDGCDDLLRYIVHKEGGSASDVLLAAVADRVSSLQEQKGYGRWLADMPVKDWFLGGSEEKNFFENIKKRTLDGKKFSVLAIQQEYEKLKGRKYRRVTVLRMIKHYGLYE